MLQKITAAVIVTFIFLGVTSSYGGVMVTTASGSQRQDWAGTVGFKFTAGATPLFVTDLGAYDFGSPGFLNTTNTGLWDSSGALLASVTFSGGNVTAGTTVIGDYRYQSITPVPLTAGSVYYLGSFFPFGGDTWLGDNGSGDAYSPLITVNGSAYSLIAGLQWPQYIATTASTSYDGPNAIFAIPEPAIIGVLGLLPILSRRRRR